MLHQPLPLKTYLVAFSDPFSLERDRLGCFRSAQRQWALAQQLLSVADYALRSVIPQ